MTKSEATIITQQLSKAIALIAKAAGSDDSVWLRLEPAHDIVVDIRNMALAEIEPVTK